MGKNSLLSVKSKKNIKLFSSTFSNNEIEVCLYLIERRWRISYCFIAVIDKWACQDHYGNQCLSFRDQIIHDRL